MKRSLVLASSVLLLTLAGCGPKEAEAPVQPEKSVAETRRENWFGAKIAAEPGIAWRESGLGLKTLKEGEGPLPQRTDKVRVIYVGRLVDGTEFDRSAPDKPAVFRVQELVTGLAAGVGSMRAGGKAFVYIPPHLGYGGIRAGRVPPNSALIFEIEVLELNPKS